MDLGLTGKVAIVTGGSHGIGRAAAESFCREGARVAIAARDQGDLDTAAGAIAESTGGEIVGISTDVTQEDQVQKLVGAVVDRWRRVDILVNNAGHGNANSFDDMTNEILHDDIGLKVFAAIYGMRAVRPHMQSQGGGAVLNITTAGGKASGPSSQPTALSRAAGISLTKCWSKEFAGENIRVNTVCIGSIKSRQNIRHWEPMHEKDPSYTLERHWAESFTGVPMGRIGESEEAGDIIVFLCSERASYVTGASVNVDGGSAPVV